MKTTLINRIFFAGFALALMIIASVSEAKVDVPTTVSLRRVDDGSSWNVKTATIDVDGNFSFTNVPAGKYELVITGTQAYFTAKAKDPNLIEINEFTWGSVKERNLINTSKSNIKHNNRVGSEPAGSGGDTIPTALINTTHSNIRHSGLVGSGPAGGGGDTISTSSITTTRSNIKHQRVSTTPNSMMSANIGGKTVYYQSLMKDITFTGDTSPHGTITGFAISENGGK